MTAPTAASVPPREQQAVPDTPVRLPEGFLACAGCGVAVAVDSPGTEVVRALALRREGTPNTVGGQEVEVELAVCRTCRALRRHALALARAHPRLTKRIGSQEVAADRLLNALYAVAVSRGADAALTLEVGEVELHALLAHLTVPGAQARWLARFSPVLAKDANPSTCSPYPWAHVKVGARAALRSAHAAVLRERVAAGAPPVDLSPPGPLAGCLVCGVASVRVTALEVARAGGREAAALGVWTGMRALPQALGGRPGPEPLSGDLCPACAAAVQAVGSVGPSAMERSLTAHLRATGREQEGSRLRSGEVSGLVTWGALVDAAQRRGQPAPEANSRPWDHVRIVSG